MKYLLLLLPFIVGCNSSVDEIVNSAYNELCERQPDSMSCTKHEDIGFTPSFQTVVKVNYELLDNFTYKTDIEQYGVDEYWFDNELSSNSLVGDCDDIALTFASQLILDGIKPSNIRFIASGIHGQLNHYYVRVKLDDGTYFNFEKIKKYTDIMYMQYDNIGVFVK